MSDTVTRSSVDGVSDPDLVRRLSRECQLLAGRLASVPAHRIPALLRDLAHLIPNPPAPIGRMVVHYLIIQVVLQVRAIVPGWRREWDTHLIGLMAPDPANASTTRRLLWQTITFLEGSMGGGAPARPLSTQAERKVNAVLDEVRRHYQDGRFGLRSAAAHVQLTPWHLDRLLSRHTGYSFVHHLRNARLTAAQSILASTLLSIKEVAGKVGYNSVTHLDRDFRKHLGCSPSQWRRQNGDEALPAARQETSTDRTKC